MSQAPQTFNGMKPSFPSPLLLAAPSIVVVLARAKRCTGLTVSALSVSLHMNLPMRLRAFKKKAENEKNCTKKSSFLMKKNFICLLLGRIRRRWPLRRNGRGDTRKKKIGSKIGNRLRRSLFFYFFFFSFLILQSIPTMYCFISDCILHFVYPKSSFFPLFSCFRFCTYNVENV